MEGRIVVSFRAVGGPGRLFLERARALITRLKPLKGVHVGWDVTKITFAFDASQLEPVLEAAGRAGPDTAGEEPPWAVGIAQGDLEPIRDDASPLTSSGLLWWGPGIVAACALATRARAGEILCAETVPAIRAGKLVTSGLRVARDGTLRVRGARIDVRQPWKKVARENLARMREPTFVRAHLPPIELTASSLVVVRADPGAGGTRLLADVAARVARTLIVSPAASGFEPLGALRRALGRSLAGEVHPRLVEQAEPLEALLAGNGITIDEATALVAAFLAPKHASRPPGERGEGPSSAIASAIVVDDVKAVDPATLEACVRVVRAKSTVALVARLDRASGLPSVLASLPKVAEVVLPALSPEGAEAIVDSAVGGALDSSARSRWARLGGESPLAVVEGVAYAIASGEIVWGPGGAAPRRRGSGRGKARPVAKIISQRANAESTAERVVLSLLAVVGGEAKVAFLGRVLETSGLQLDLAATLARLERSRWLVRPEEGHVAFPSRTHHKVLFETLEVDARRKLHAAIAQVIEDEEEGIFGRVEGAWHAAQAGKPTAASGTLLEAARQTAIAGLLASTTQLIAFARRADPSCEEVALELLATALDRRASHRPRAESMPPAAKRGDVAAGPVAPPSESGSTPSNAPESQMAVRLGDLAKEALLSADNAALERSVDELRAAGESPVFTDRMSAMARLGRGEIGDALRVLRCARAELDPNDHRRRCQTSLALGLALRAAGRPDEALLEGMDALARARQIADERGAKACLAFLAKLYTSVSREEEAARLRAASR